MLVVKHIFFLLINVRVTDWASSLLDGMILSPPIDSANAPVPSVPMTLPFHRGVADTTAISLALLHIYNRPKCGCSLTLYPSTKKYIYISCLVRPVIITWSLYINIYSERVKLKHTYGSHCHSPLGCCAVMSFNEGLRHGSPK